MLKEAPRNMEVYIPMGEEFDGYFRTPCAGETGITELGLNELTNETESVFVIAPHGFFEEEIKDEGKIIPKLN